MQPLFVSCGYLSEKEQALLPLPDFKSLPPFLRALLTTDGTVTKSLESYFWERVAVKSLHQGPQVLGGDMPTIDKVGGDEVWGRRVSLVGEKSQQVYASAASYICLERLPSNMQVALKSGSIGIGGFLRECGYETYRQILSIGMSQSDELGPQIWRTYRIVMSKQPLMAITESFPLSVYQTQQ